VLFLVGLVACDGDKAASVQNPPAADSPTSAAAANPLPTDTSAPTKETGPWNAVVNVDRQKFAVNVVGFFDDSLGYTAGYGGEIHHTSDGGKTWSAGANASACLFGIDILDAQTAWTIGNMGHVRMTRDGGKTWQALADVPIGKSFFISMADETSGWAAHDAKLVATGDGGQTWTEILLPADLKTIAAIQLRAAGEGYVLDSLGTLYVTGDGGESWTAKPLGVEGKITAPKSMPAAAIRFTDSANGVVIFTMQKGDGSLNAMHTADGGTTWTRETLPVKVGVLFLSRDGRYLTVLKGDNSIVVLRYQSLTG
jgi:photosystem II stability/assembly factor-like uncharacterized protein